METPNFSTSVTEASVERLDLDGRGRAGAWAVPFSLPGERVRGPLEEGVLSPAEILERSEHRVDPVCRHYGVCGGCSLQHASDAFIEEWKLGVVRRALAARGLQGDARQVSLSPARSRRRAVFAGRRTRKSAMVGFHGRRSDTLVEITECHVVRPEIMAGREALRALTQLGASRSGAVRLGVTWGAAGLDVDVRDAKPLDGASARASASALADLHGLARLSWNGDVISERSPPFQKMGRARVKPPPGAFLQATVEAEEALVGAALRHVEGARRVADLFAGCGAFALPVAERAEVHAVEGGAEMLAALANGARDAQGLRPVTIEVRDLFRRPLLPRELGVFDAIVIDPPRAGAEAQIREIAASGVARVAMVSCNPVTFARDAALLVGAGFRMGEVAMVDQFRWSGHIELVAGFSR